jgi:hypothetical protein
LVSFDDEPKRLIYTEKEANKKNGETQKAKRVDITIAGLKSQLQCQARSFAIETPVLIWSLAKYLIIVYKKSRSIRKDPFWFSLGKRTE